MPCFAQANIMAAEQGELEQQLEQHEAQPGSAGNDEVADAQAVAACPTMAPERAPFAQECPSLTTANPGSALGRGTSARSAGRPAGGCRVSWHVSEKRKEGTEPQRKGEQSCPCCWARSWRR